MANTLEAKHLNLASHPDFDAHLDVVQFSDPASGLSAIIAVHDTTMGPSLGGCRFLPYANEEDAITDVLRLSSGMTYKSALAGLALGGGKSVIIGDPKKHSPESRGQLMKAMGHAVHSLSGRYIVAEDMNTNEFDMAMMAKVTPHVGGLPQEEHEDSIGGNPSPITAMGVFSGIKATAKALNGNDDLTNLTVAVQGLGSVGMALCDHLHNAGAKLIASDINQAALDEAKSKYGAQIVGLDEIYASDCDVFAPCARGAILNDDTIPVLKAKAIAGAANNQLKNKKHGQMLHDRGILYAPDYVVNAGGVMIIAAEVLGAESYDAVMRQVKGIYDTTSSILSMAKDKNITTAEAADVMAKDIIAQKKKMAAA